MAWLLQPTPPGPRPTRLQRLPPCKSPEALTPPGSHPCQAPEATPEAASEAAWTLADSEPSKAGELTARGEQGSLPYQTPTPGCLWERQTSGQPSLMATVLMLVGAGRVTTPIPAPGTAPWGQVTGTRAFSLDAQEPASKQINQQASTFASRSRDALGPGHLYSPSAF